MEKIILDEVKKIAITEENAQKINIDYATLKNYPNWYSYQNSLYYFKKANLARIRNHLLGAKIANYFYLKAPRFFIVKKEGTLGLLSQNFRQPNVFYDYFDYEISEFFVNSPLDVINAYRNYFNNEKDFREYINSLFRLIALQMAINLEDLTADNILIRRLNNKKILDFIYDFDYAFTKLRNKEHVWYESAIMSLEVPSEAFYKLCEAYPYFKTQLLRILNLDILKYIKGLETEYDFDFNAEHYLEQCAEIKDFIRSLKL